MEKSVAKAFYIDGSYQRKNLYGREHALTMKKPGTTPKEHLVDRSSIGVSVVYGDHSNSPPVLNTKGITPILPTFDGQSSRSFVLWLCEIKCYFLSQYIPESMKCELVVSCLKEAALLWYATLNLKRKMEGKGRIRSWHKLESHMRKEFTLSPTMSELQTRGENLKQQLLSINKIAKPCTKPMPNMNSKLKNIQAYHDPKPETIEPSSLKIIFPHSDMNQLVSKKNLAREKMKCFHCQGFGHLRKDCPSTKTPLEITCSNDRAHKLTSCVEKSITSTIETESLLVKGSSVCMGTVVSGNHEDQIFMEPYPDVMVKDSVCVLPDHPKHLVESPCEEVSQVNAAHIDEDLNTIRVESMDVQNHSKKGVNPIFTSSAEEEQSDTSLDQINGAQQKDGAAVPSIILSTYLSPLDLYINKRLRQPLNLDMGQFLTLHDGKKCWSPNINDQKECSHFNCSKIQIFISHTTNCPNSKHNYLPSIKCVLSMPHFHFYMLKNMQASLVQMGAIPYTSEVFVPRISKWKPPVCGAMDHIDHCCPDLISLCFKESNVPNICGELLRTSSSGSSLNVEGILAHLAMSMMGTTNQGSSSPLVVDPGKMRSAWVGKPSEFGAVPTPEPNHMIPTYDPGGNFGSLFSKQSEIEVGTALQRRLSYELNFGARLKALKVAWQPMVILLFLSMLNMPCPEHETANYIIPRQFMLIFDPGGFNHVQYLIMQKCYTPLLRMIINGYEVKEMSSFNQQNLRSNSFEPGEVAAGARPRGLSFLMPRNDHGLMPKDNKLWCPYFDQEMDLRNLKCSNSLRISVLNSTPHI